MANGRDDGRGGDDGNSKVDAGAPGMREVRVADGKARIRVLEYMCPPPLYELI